MSAFVAHPMGAQKQLRMSLGPLLCVWALGQCIRLSAAPKLAKSLTKAKSNKMGGTAPRWGTNSDVSLCCTPNGCPQAVANVSRATALPLGAWSVHLPLSSPKASKVTSKSQTKQNGWHGATIGNKHRCEPLVWTQWMPKSSCECHLGHCVAFGRMVSTFAAQQPQSCLLYTSPSPRDVEESRMPSSA